MSLNGRVYQTDLRNLTAGVAFKYKGKDYFVLNQENPEDACEGCCFYDEVWEEQNCTISGPRCWNNGKDFIFKELS